MNYQVKISYIINVINAPDEVEAENVARDEFIEIMPTAEEMNYEVKELK